MNENIYYTCPVGAWDCPYYNLKTSYCSLEDAIHNCDDAAYYNTDYDWDEDDFN